MEDDDLAWMFLRELLNLCTEIILICLLRPLAEIIAGAFCDAVDGDELVIIVLGRESQVKCALACFHLFIHVLLLALV